LSDTSAVSRWPAGHEPFPDAGSDSGISPPISRHSSIDITVAGVEDSVATGLLAGAFAPPHAAVTNAITIESLNMRDITTVDQSLFDDDVASSGTLDEFIDGWR
jgi:hypothetical protein